MQIESYYHTGAFETRKAAWKMRLIKTVDKRYCNIIRERTYLPPTSDEQKAGFCASTLKEAARGLEGGTLSTVLIHDLTGLSKSFRLT